MSWIEKYAFTRNPFSLEPVNPFSEGVNAFVDREYIKSVIDDLSSVGSMRIMILSGIGEGKSSTINYAEYIAKKKGKKVLKIEIHGCKTVEDLVYHIIRRLRKKIKSTNPEILKKLDYLDKKENLVEEESSNSIEKGTTLGLGIPVAKGEKDEKIEERKSTKTVCFRSYQLLDEFKGVLSALEPGIILIDDVDKIPPEIIPLFLQDFLSSIPIKHSIVVTGDEKTLQNPYLVSEYFKNLDQVIPLEPIDSDKKLQEFIVGRMLVFSTRPNLIKELISKSAYAMLFDRTHGNIRESLRYLQTSMRIIKRNGAVDGGTMYRAIAETDKVKIDYLTSEQKEAIITLSVSEEFTIKDVEKILKLTRQKAVQLIDTFRQLNMVFLIKLGYRGKGGQAVYIIPKTLSKILKGENSSSLQTFI